MPKKEIDYSKSIIYKIVCKDPEVKECYVGSTTDLTRRRQGHKNTCNNVNDKRSDLYVYRFIRENGGFDNWEVVKIEDYPCENREDLHKRERYNLETLKASLNTVIPSRKEKEQKKEYYLKNRDKFIEYTRKHQKQFYEKAKKHLKEKVMCDCGGKYTYWNLKQHQRTKKHQKWLNNQENDKS